MLRFSSFLVNIFAFWAVLASATVFGADRTSDAGPGCVDVGDLPYPSAAPGYPSRDPALDALPGFRNPPSGYGEVPFWWWTGDPLDRERLLWQVEELHKKGVTGMQVNYAHQDTRGWPTYSGEPKIFSPEWWEIWKTVASRCGELDMGIGISGYTLDWPNGQSVVSRMIYNESAIQGRELRVAFKKRVVADQEVKIMIPADMVAVRAYPTKPAIGPDSIDLSHAAVDQWLSWPPPKNVLPKNAPPKGAWEIWIFTAARKPGTLNPIHPLAGRRVVEKFFQPFEDHAPDRSAAGLNFFFHDELRFGVGDRIWTDDLAEQFRRRKGYDLFEVLPAMFQNVGPKTAKYRLDFMDVKTQLTQERYFIPIFRWHYSRGKIFGCDQGGRGKKPIEFGDYFRSVRWYTAPGHDTPGGRADLIKGKVSSSIAQLYKRPRVWLEGYHSLGWSASPERLMAATVENYIYGCNLLSLHGLYYTTHGSFWEWAPPCYHFRMPYWDHMGTFLKYFERLSYLMSQGVHQCDVAVLYPVAPSQAGLGGKQATTTAFETGRDLFSGGYDFIFLDFESLARAKIDDRQLHVSDASYRVLILPAMRAIRWSTLQKAREFFRAGGIVVAVGALPEASDHAGSNDPALDAVVKEIFGATAAEVKAGVQPGVQSNPVGGAGIFLPASTDSLHTGLVDTLKNRVSCDVQAERPLKMTHRKIGPREVYMVMGAKKGSKCTFRATGRAELWDPWTGDTRPLHVVSRDATHTTVRMPLEENEAQLIVFTLGGPSIAIPRTTLAEITNVEATGDDVTVTGYADRPGEQAATVRLGEQTITLRGTAVASLPPMTLDGLWRSEFKPTMDNRWGDFRLPATKRTKKIIGPEARIFRYAEEAGGKAPRSDYGARDFDDSRWRSVTYGFGRKFWKLGPLPDKIDLSKLEAKLAALESVDPAVPVELDGKQYAWQPYEFSWRWGTAEDPGHQGYHGLKEKVSDDFIRLGQPRRGMTRMRYEPEPAGSHYYLWTTVVSPEPTTAKVVAGGKKFRPAAFYLNGAVVADLKAEVKVKRGRNPLLLRYDFPGCGHFVLEKIVAPSSKKPSMPTKRTPLSMSWYDRPDILPMDAFPATKRAGWYRFVAPPGLRGMTLTAYGTVRAWVDGRPVAVTRGKATDHGAVEYRLTLDKLLEEQATVAICIEPLRGYYGGSALPEPIELDCGAGWITLGDWSKGSALECYSGGLWYRKKFTLDSSQASRHVFLDLGKVVATAEVRINGRSVGVRVAPPWRFDITPYVKKGENQIEVLIYNTLSNHYRTVPTRYRGDSRSGLFGPVRLEFLQKVTLER